MRLLYVTDALAIYGGLERILVDKANRFSEESEYEVFLITVNQGKHPVVYPLNSQVNYTDIGIQFHQIYKYKGAGKLCKLFQLRWRYQRRIKAKIKEIAPDIIICLRTELTSAVVKAKGSIPLVFESHTSCKGQFVIDSDFVTKVKVNYSNLSVRNAQRVVALTEGDASVWRKINRNVCVIPNIVHLNETGEYSDCEAESVIFVGRFSRQKGIRSLLEVWKVVHERKPNWQLQIYGGYGEELASLMPIIEQMNANIHVHEPTSDIMNKYKESSILLMTSAYEPFGLVLPEAMSCGLPVVAFDCPYGPSDIITDGEDGFIIPNRDIQLFADKVCLLMDNLNLRRKMGKTGIASSRRYEAKLIMPQWKELFEQLTKKR